jgi:hypothetical protein
LSGFVSSGFSVGGGNGYKGAFAMAIVGGTVSELGGGKFANGAMGSAFQYLFNDAVAATNKYLTNATIKENDRVGGLGNDDFMEEFGKLGFAVEDNINVVKMSLRRQFIQLSVKGIESDLFVPLPTSIPTGGKGFGFEALKWLSPNVYSPNYNFNYSCTSSNCKLDSVYEK